MLWQNKQNALSWRCPYFFPFTLKTAWWEMTWLQLVNYHLQYQVPGMQHTSLLATSYYNNENENFFLRSASYNSSIAISAVLIVLTSWILRILTSFCGEHGDCFAEGPISFVVVHTHLHLKRRERRERLVPVLIGGGVCWRHHLFLPRPCSIGTKRHDIAEPISILELFRNRLKERKEDVDAEVVDSLFM